MIHKIINFFSNNKTKKEKTNDIVFSIHKNGNTDIEIFIRNYDDTDANYLANTLHQINYGLYSEDLYTILTDIAHKDNNYKNFVQKTIIKWSVYLINNTKYNTPIIAPSKFCLNNHE